jgi:CO/xanthine dehydrogenase Mo-binding subunit
LSQLARGQSVRRIEDTCVVTGRGRFADDMSEPGEAHGHVLRSSHAHADVKRLNVAAAIDALLDAMQPLSIRHVDMPAAPLKLWRLIRVARRRELMA